MKRAIEVLLGNETMDAVSGSSGGGSRGDGGGGGGGDSELNSVNWTNAMYGNFELR